MPSSRWIQAAIYLAAFVGLVPGVLRGDWPSPSDLSGLGTVSFAVIVLLGIFEHWGWKAPIVHRLTGRPRLHGTWKAELHSTWVNPDTDAGVPPKPVYITIRQSYSDIKVRMLFDISTSRSMTAQLREEDGVYTLWTVYRSESDMHNRDGNPPHLGATYLTVAKVPTCSIKGNYWTERQTRGTIQTSGHNRKCFDRFEDADDATYS